MEEEIPKKYPTLGKYILLKTLGKGYNSKVKLGSFIFFFLRKYFSIFFFFCKAIIKRRVLTTQ